MFLLIFAVSAQPIIYHNKHCACEELQQEECSNLNMVCEYKDNSCQPKSQQWMDCNLLNTQQLCANASCYWNKENECDQFESCSDYSAEYCPWDKDCVVTNGMCDQLEYVNCGDFETRSECGGKTSITTMCAWKENEKNCQQINISPSCEEMSDFGLWLCEYYQCQYNATSSQCIPYSCGTQQNTTFNRITQYSSYYCGTDISTLTNISCFTNTSFNYVYDANTQACKQCNNLVEYTNSQIIVLTLLIYLLN